MRPLLPFAAVLLIVLPAVAQDGARVVDIPSRPGVTQRVLVLGPAAPRAAVVLFAGGHGGLQISPDGRFAWGGGNFLVRSRRLFAEQGLLVAVLDAPSDRQNPPYLGGFRQTPDHVTDVGAVVAWLKQQAPVPVWLVGTSRGTQSAAFVATRLSVAAGGGPDGLVLTSTILSDDRGRPVPDMELQRINVPVLVVHHRQDGCRHCAYRDLPRLMGKLASVPRAELLTLEGGVDRGDPCEASGHHGFNGLERDVVGAIAAWIATPRTLVRPEGQR
jgi:pimeloyl-ACP methyl ester carboxylesterase